MTKLESFIVLRKLSVDDIRISARQIKARYCITHFDGTAVSTELIYSYENPVFSKNSAADTNLASMILAQVALNYGLFAETIEFDGLFDKTDRRFIADMMENTSREILTNKLLIRNEFLKAPWDSLMPERRARYTQAKLVFINTRFQQSPEKANILETDPDKYAILSSGGKDSLLTYGLINEIGKAYPVYINESGRHWFTAVNAYKHFKSVEPNTEKPWCNSDRVFNWMLKQLPFIRENYASIRADIYPIRLWTVAVFLFGVLPIVKKYGIGNILIGDEYDTTVRGSSHGISHYNGLYDQSRHFDNAMTRYFRKKGWQVRQYSILRSMSELLIMKVLIKRYPDLQRHQISCHAAHEVSGRMHPCGNCEKCRRIIGMLKALDENPERCGYDETRINKGLKALEKRSVKQIGSDASHLYFLLLSQGLIERNEHTKKLAQEHPEILKLRFDKERSRLEEIPAHLRRPLFSILQEYADGTVIMNDRKWIETNILKEMNSNNT